jgi:hypothetical protein
MTSASDRQLLRISLVVVWLATGIVSLLELGGQSQALMFEAGVHDPEWARAAVLCGVVVDVLLGLALWLRPVRVTYLCALAAVLGMTFIATVMAPAWWLHPLGPLLKNIPIAAILWMLARKPA